MSENPATSSIHISDATKKPSVGVEEGSELESGAQGILPVPPADKRQGGLHRGLSTRQVSMIAIAGTIGTGLFLGTGQSLAEGGPASMLICYAIVGVVVYIALLLLGEMATQYPIAGEWYYASFPFSDRRRFVIVPSRELMNKFWSQGPSTHTLRASSLRRTGSPCLGITGSTMLSPWRPT